jgi:NTP pyrophosphatase (non-canonical NTP hydrolase)
MQKNELTLAQRERLAILTEELGETQQVIGKILRHGWDSSHPKNNIPNRQLLETELGDILAALYLLQYGNDINLERLEFPMRTKLNKFKNGEGFLHYQDLKDDFAKDV